MSKARHGTLTANTVATVSIAADHADIVVVQLDQGSITDPVYVTINGDDPTVGGNDTFKVQAVGEHRRSFQIPTADVGSNTVVKLISAGAHPYSVEVHNG
jgi:hypothetical protein